MNIKIVAFTVLICIIISTIVFFAQKEKIIEKEESFDIKICDDIKTYDLKLICLSIFTDNPSRCKEAGNFDNYCYESTFEAMKNFSESLCKGFSDYSPRTLCYLRLAETSKDPSLCEKAGGRYQECSWELAKITKNQKLCEEIEVDFEQNECLAEVTGDVSFCEKIISDIERGTCFIMLGKNADIKKCGEIVSIENPSYAYSQQCIVSVALATKDISLCDLIENKEARWRCLASLSKSIDICKGGENQFWEDFCKIEFIKSTFTQKT